MQKVILAVIALVILSGCSAHGQQFYGYQNSHFGNNSNYTGPNTGSDYRGQEARRRQTVQVGTVVDMREVNLTSRRSGGAAETIGAGIGGALGALAGSRVGQGAGTQVAQVALGLLGAWGGSRAAEVVDTVNEVGLEIIVEFPNREMVAVTQAIDAQAAQLRIGDTVRLVEGNLVRVAKHRQAPQPSQTRKSTSAF